MSPEEIQQWANTGLTWIGFGTLVGLLAKLIMPGRDPGGALATTMMGIGGTVIGCGILSLFHDDGKYVTPISPVGFAVATGGAFIILFFFRVLAGQLFDEDDGGRLRWRRRRRYQGAYED